MCSLAHLQIKSACILISNTNNSFNFALHFFSQLHSFIAIIVQKFNSNVFVYRMNCTLNQLVIISFHSLFSVRVSSIRYYKYQHWYFLNSIDESFLEILHHHGLCREIKIWLLQTVIHNLPDYLLSAFDMLNGSDLKTFLYDGWLEWIESCAHKINRFSKFKRYQAL